MSSSSQRSSTPSMIFASAAAYTQQLQSHMKGKGLKVARCNYVWSTRIKSVVLCISIKFLLPLFSISFYIYFVFSGIQRCAILTSIEKRIWKI